MRDNAKGLFAENSHNPREYIAAVMIMRIIVEKRFRC
jgi:hypothetical protein